MEDLKNHLTAAVVLSGQETLVGREVRNLVDCLNEKIKNVSIWIVKIFTFSQ